MPGRGRHAFVVAAVVGLVAVAVLAAQSSGKLVSGESAKVAQAAPGMGVTQPALSCSALASQNFAGIPGAPTSVLSAVVVAATASAPEFCRVIGYVEPQVQFEIDLPTTTWNGRYFQAGCGGLCGSVQIANCMGALQNNFAVAAQDMGHIGSSSTDGVWGRGSRDLRIDFAYRSTHVVALAGKAIVARYYGQAAAKSYFGGCSTGGGEGLHEATQFPNDFDGIIAGDPVFYTRQGGIYNAFLAQQLNTPDGQPVFTQEKLQLLHNAVLVACDAIDGQTDGIIDDPRSCHFDPAKLACPAGQDLPTCLTTQQVSSAEHIYSGPRNARGDRLYPGNAFPGSELNWSAPRELALSSAFLRDLAFPEPKPADFTALDFNIAANYRQLEQWARIYDPVAPYQSPNLRAFDARGGKVIMYHGWADPTVAPTSTLDFYAEVARDTPGSITNWMRVFMVPGMGHCGGGSAPTVFSATPGANAYAGRMLDAMVNWVENGQAPDSVVATQYDSAGNVVRSRPVFAYPKVARYSGQGDINDAANWVAEDPPVTYNDLIRWVWSPRSDFAADVHGRQPTGGPNRRAG